MGKRLAVLAVALGSWVVMPAWAQESGAYVGASLGQAEHQDTCGLLPGASCDEKDTAWKILAGYQFNRHLAIELGHSDLGQSSVSADFGGLLGSSSAKFDITAFELVGVGMFPFADRLSLFAKLGLYRAEVKARGTLSNESGSDVDITFGFGIRFDLTRNLGIRAEWQRYSNAPGGRTIQLDTDFLSAGAIWRF